MTDLITVMSEEDEYYGMTKEAFEAGERDHWNGDGDIEFFVIQHTKDNFEIEVIDYSGCAGGLEETLGIEYTIKNLWCLHKDDQFIFREGVFYTIHGLTVTWTRGDGWTTDNDVEYNFESITHHTSLWLYISHKISMIWWRAIGHHIRKWNNS